MCCSFLGQILYGILMFVCLCLTLTAMLTPGWREVKDDNGESHHMGLWKFACNMPSDSGSYSTPAPGQTGKDFCEEWWKNLKTFEKAVIICIVLAVVAEITALVWNFFTLCACCCKKYLIHPLSAISFLVALFLALTVLIYGVNNKDAIKDIDWGDASATKHKSDIGYSFYLTCAALAVAVADIVVGALTVALADHCL